MITAKTHPTRVQIRSGFVVAFPASMSHDEIADACSHISSEVNIRSTTEAADIIRAGAKGHDLIARLSEDERIKLRQPVLDALREKCKRLDGSVDAAKARKIFYSLGPTARAIFGDQFVETKRMLDAASKQQYLGNK
jgi:hypothetical protein